MLSRETFIVRSCCRLIPIRILLLILLEILAPVILGIRRSLWFSLLLVKTCSVRGSRSLEASVTLQMGSREGLNPNKWGALMPVGRSSSVWPRAVAVLPRVRLTPFFGLKKRLTSIRFLCAREKTRIMFLAAVRVLLRGWATLLIVILGDSFGVLFCRLTCGQATEGSRLIGNRAATKKFTTNMARFSTRALTRC